MKSVAYAAALGAWAQVANAALGNKCDGAHFPDYDDCDQIIDFFGLRDNNDIVAYNGEDGPEPSCTWWYWEDGNCRISECWTVTNAYANENGYSGRLETTGANVARGYDSLREICEPLRAGGELDAAENVDGKSWVYSTVFNDPDQSPPSAKLRSRNGKPTPDRFVKETVTKEEHDKWAAGVKARNEKKKRSAALEARHAAVMASKREDGDDGWYINNSGTDVRQPGVYDTGPRASNGITTQYSTTESQTFTTTTSVNIGGAFEVFSAGISYEYSESDTFSVTKGLTFTPNCKDNQEGQAFFYPFFDYYDVTFSPSGQRSDIWLPVPEGDGMIKGELEVQCIG